MDRCINCDPFYRDISHTVILHCVGTDRLVETLQIQLDKKLIRVFTASYSICIFII